VSAPARRREPAASRRGPSSGKVFATPGARSPWRRPWRRLTAPLAIGLVTWLLGGTPARAYDFSLSLRTVGQGYQERRYSAGGAAELLSRRRLTQYLNLSVFAIEPARWSDPEHDTNRISFELGLRFDSDFGSYTSGRPQGADSIGELSQNQMDVLFAYLLARDLHGRVDVQLGRQLHYDRVDFYSFDGADVWLRLTRFLRVRGFGGTEVRGELPLSAPLYEIDGTSVGSRDPATRPEQARAWRPMVGGGVELDGASAPMPFLVQAGYRRAFSETMARRPGDPASGINHESISVTADAHWAERLFFTAGLRYNLLVGMTDDQQLVARLRLGDGHFLTAEYSYLAPTFDGDSIWNVFAAGAYRDLRAGYDVRLWRDWRLHARGFLREFVDSDRQTQEARMLSDQAPGGRRSYGGNLGADGRSDRARLRVDLYGDAGFGGWKVGGDMSGRWSVNPRRLDVEGRATVSVWRADGLPEPQTAVVAGLGAGAIYRMSPKIRLHVLGEDNRGTYYRSQVRGLMILEVDVSL
jgi:hypothetical protein